MQVVLTLVDVHLVTHKGHCQVFFFCLFFVFLQLASPWMFGEHVITVFKYFTVITI